MRIAFLTTEYPTEKLFAGGLASYLRRTASTLAAMGHEVEVFTLSDSAGRVGDGEVVVHRVYDNPWLKRRMARLRYFWRYGGYTGVIEPSLRLAIAARRRHRSRPLDVIQAASYRACGLVSAYWRFVPLVTRVSSYEPLWRDAYQKPRSPPQRQIERCEIAQLRRSDYVYSPSKLLEQTLREVEKVDCHILEPPFDAEGFAAQSDCDDGPVLSRPYALFFGSIGVLKGCDRLVKVLPYLLRTMPDLSFLFVGRVFNDPCGRSFDVVIGENLGEFGDRVQVWKERAHRELMPILRRARVVVLPSRIDNLPNACLEAMAMGKVVIATRDASFEQLIEEGVNGFLVSQHDDAELATRIEAVWRMPDAQLRALGDAARRSLERLHPQKAAQRLVGVFRDVCERWHGTRRRCRRLWGGEHVNS